MINSKDNIGKILKKDGFNYFSRYLSIFYKACLTMNGSDKAHKNGSISEQLGCCSAMLIGMQAILNKYGRLS